jgi:hypothetical protein
MKQTNEFSRYVVYVYEETIFIEYLYADELDKGQLKEVFNASLIVKREENVRFHRNCMLYKR